MASKAAAELREINDTELFERIASAREELFNLRFQHATGRLESHGRMKHLRKDIARALTEVRAREIAAAEALAAQEENV